MIHYPVRGTPLQHQQRALEEANLKPGHAFYMDPGAGKTFTCIAEAGLLYLRGEIDGVIITAPNGAHEQWIDEQFPQWAAYPWRGMTNRMTPAKTKAWLTRAAHEDACGVLSINHDALRTPNGKKLVAAFLQQYPRIYFVDDESQKMKDQRAARTKAAIDIATRARYARILSGTPILKGIEDLFTQYEIACPKQGITGFHNYHAFRNYYCVLEQIYGRNVDPRAKKIVGYQNENELMRRTAPYVTRVMASEFMHGEKPSFMTVRAPMGDAQARAYLQMKELLLTQIDGQLITAKNALVSLQKLMQIAAGFIYPDAEFTTADEESDGGLGEGLRYEHLGNNKVDAVTTLLEGLDERVIIWAPYKALQQMLLIELGDLMERGKLGRRGVMQYYGSDSISWFREQPNGVLIANQGSGAGVGLNLQFCAANIYVANTFAAEHRWQSLKRTDRIGQERQVRVWDIVTPDTVDMKALRSLADKEDISRRNIDGIREMLG